MSLNRLDGPTRALVALAGAIAAGEEAELEARCRGCVGAKVAPAWVDELLLQSLLMCGWPRALNAAMVWRRAGAAAPAPGEDGADYGRAAEWTARGELVCRAVYGTNYERLRANVRVLHPALDAWMVTEGYGRTLGRPGLDLARRECCVVAQVAVQGAERQLHSHLLGARRAGAGKQALEQVLDIVRPLLGPLGQGVAERLWDRVVR
ncbi:MAG TPA: carboxymuconolactone decarboxylase family protein [Gemmatimonadales bacterium]|nr:carboxymuconolactone decarboxylase family protein [Gemmatimonadales bacterium]